MSANTVITDPCIVFALRRESMSFRRHFPFRRRFPGAPCRAQFRGSSPQAMLVLETGMGAAVMEKALHWCLSMPRISGLPYRPRFVLSAGFSGALQPEQRVGDLILGTEFIDLQRNSYPRSHAPRGNAIGDAPHRLLTKGRLLTVPELVGDPREKQRLGKQYEALAVDMETAIIARLCQEHDIPLLCLRVISDDLNTPLSPHLAELLRRGRIAPVRLMRTIFRHPSLLRELGRLAGQTRLAACRLLTGISELLHGLPAREEDGR